MNTPFIIDAQEIHIIGIELRTDNIHAFETIPPFWAKFYALGGPRAIGSRLSNTVYAVYTNFSHPWIDNLWEYSLILGCEVPREMPVPEGFLSITISAEKRRIFPIETGHPEKVWEKWVEIWKDDSFVKNYICDYEEYKENGEIAIYIWTH